MSRSSGNTALLSHPPDPAKDTAGALSLYDIERGLVDLLSEYEDCENDQERANVRSAIDAYNKAEVLKVDAVISYIRHCDLMEQAAQEIADRYAERGRAWARRRELLKESCQTAMEAGAKKKLEGASGYLLVKTNGGLAPLVITDESMIPDECCEYRGRVSAPLWQRTLKQCPWLEPEFAGDTVKMERAVNNKLVRESLAKGPVAGAYLEVRGAHLEIKA